MLSIDEQGALYWNNKPIAEPDLEPRLAEVASRQPQPELHLRAEKTMLYEQLARVMAAAQTAGIHTGYASIATAVETIKLGATHYLTKPADADEIIAAFGHEQGDARTPIVEDARVGEAAHLGAHPEGAHGMPRQHLGRCAAPRHAPAHPAVEAQKVSGR